MENLLNPSIECTDPDVLQFCLKISDTEFWYCQVNDSRDCLLPESSSIWRFILEHFTGEPKALLEMSLQVHEVRKFITNSRLWLTANLDVMNMTVEEQLELLNDYGYSWNDFGSDKERSQIISENYFETYLFDFDND